MAIHPNQILTFAPDGTTSGFDLLSQAEYEGDNDRERGNQPGIARRELVNKALRQCAFMASGLAEWIAGSYPNGVVDDGDVSKIVDGINFAVTSAVTGTSENTPNMLVKRDASGGFSAGVINTTGITGYANRLQNTRTFGLAGAAVTATPTSFDGTANVTLNVTSLNASSLNSGTVPAERLSGSYNIAIAGTAATATILATARTVQTNLASTAAASFNGSANIAPGVTGILPVSNGGTGGGSVTAAAQSLFSTNIISPTLIYTGTNSFATSGFSTPGQLRGALGLGATAGVLGVQYGGTGNTTGTATNSPLWNSQSMYIGAESGRTGVGIQFCW